MKLQADVWLINPRLCKPGRAPDKKVGTTLELAAAALAAKQPQAAIIVG